MGSDNYNSYCQCLVERQGIICLEDLEIDDLLEVIVLGLGDDLCKALHGALLKQTEEKDRQFAMLVKTLTDTFVMVESDLVQQRSTLFGEQSQRRRCDI